MKPSDIILTTPPLTGCFKKTEAECGAALLILYYQRHGDEWGLVTPRQLGQSMNDEELEKEPLRSWNRNPFFKPDLARLSNDGFITAIDGSQNQAIGFTELGLERLRNSPWNRASNS